MNTGAAKPNVAVDIRRGIVQIQCERLIIRPIIPIAAPDRRANQRLDSFTNEHIINR